MSDLFNSAHAQKTKLSNLVGWHIKLSFIMNSELEGLMYRKPMNSTVTQLMVFMYRKIHKLDNYSASAYH